jgi:CBS domain-containing protein
MSMPPLVGTRETTLAEISELFTRHAINRLPICDEQNRPLGIVTRTDLVASLCAGGQK